jgi:hypothetical protein
VLDQFERLGRAWRENDENDTDYETLIRHLLEGQCNNPVRVVAFNTDEGWSRDASDDVVIRTKGTEMGRQVVAGALYALAMVAVIVGVDVAFFRNRFWERLVVNVGIVFVFAAFYL